jgi:hypothetical protein
VPGVRCDKTWQECPLRHWFFEQCEYWVDKDFYGKHANIGLPPNPPDWHQVRYEGEPRFTMDGSVFSSSRQMRSALRDAQPPMKAWNGLSKQPKAESSSQGARWEAAAASEKAKRAQGRGGGRGGKRGS